MSNLTPRFDLAAHLASHGNLMDSANGNVLGDFLPRAADYREFADLDGKAAAAWLEAHGATEVTHADNGRNGLATGKLGDLTVTLSTNGFATITAA